MTLSTANCHRPGDEPIYDFANARVFLEHAAAAHASGDAPLRTAALKMVAIALRIKGEPEGEDK